MKNLKTKIGISLAALACFATFNLACGKEKVKPDSNVMKVVETLNQVGNVSYQLPDGRTISFSYSKHPLSKEGEKQYLELRISKESEEAGRAFTNKRTYDCRAIEIRDYDLNNLDSRDEITYIRSQYDPHAAPPFDTRETKLTVNFNELSSEAQREIKKEYDALIKEAPEKLSNEYKKFKQKVEQQEEQRRKELEKNALEILRNNCKETHGSLKYWRG